MRRVFFIFNIGFIVALVLQAFGLASQASAAGTCGTGSWTPGNLEIHHLNVGQGDSTLIVGPTGRSLLFDVGEENWNSSAQAQVIGPYVVAVLGCNALDYVVISHFHADHVGYVGYGGLWNLVEVQGFTVGGTLVRDYETYLGDTSGTFTNWKSYLEGEGQAKLHPVTAVEGTAQVDLGAGVAFEIVALDGNQALVAGNFSSDVNPPSENDYSIGAVIRFGDFDEWIGGDMDGQFDSSGFGYSYHDIELSAAPEVGDVDVYRVNHHGSSHSSNATFVGQLDPEVSIISVGDGNSYGHPTQAVMGRLLSTSTVYLTERGDPATEVGSAIVAGNIVIKTANGSSFTVNGTSYTATEPTRIDTDGDGYFTEVDPNDNSAGLKPAPSGGCDSTYQTCSAATACGVSVGQVLINELFPAPPNNGTEWIELYNTTASTVNIGECVIDDSENGSAPFIIPAGTLIPAHGFWTLDRTSYFNNATPDAARLLKEDASTVLDIYSYSAAVTNKSWVRLPDGGPWSTMPADNTTKGHSNNVLLPPVVSSIVRADPNPTNANTVAFHVTFSEDVTQVDAADFVLVQSGLTGTSITGVSGSGASYAVAVNTGAGSGTIRLDVIDNDSIRDAANEPLGGAGAGNGNFSLGETYSIIKSAPGVPVLLTPAAGAVVTDLQPTFDWKDSIPSAQHYQIQIAVDKSFAAPALDAIEIETSSFTPDPDLVPGTLYYWRVRAFNVFDVSSAWSSVRTFKTPLAQPTLVTPAMDAVLTTDRPAFEWNPGDGATQYNLQVSASAKFGTLLLNATVTGTEYTTTKDLPQNKKLYWRVRGKSPVVMGPWSANGFFTTGNPPTAPVLATPANNALLKDHTPLLNWNNSKLPTGTLFQHYEIQLDDNKEFSSPETDTTASGDLNDSDYTPLTDLPSNTKFYWRVRAINEVNGVEHTSGWSSVWWFRTIIAAPTGLIVVPNGQTPTFQWDTATGPGSIKNYTIQISTNAKFSSFLVNSTTQNLFYEMTKSLPSGKLLYWRVRVNGENGSSAWTTVQYTTP